MGVERTVTAPVGKTPSWTAVRELLTALGLAVQMRMIDGELAFPDDVPPESWTELRLGTSAGMVTVRRESDRLRLITWGNADAALIQTWNALTWAFAESSGGRILSDGEELSAAEFRCRAEFPERARPQ